VTGLRTSLSDGVGHITLDHPPLNILTRDVLAQLRDALTQWQDDHTVRALIIDGAGKHFSVGADVSEHLPPHHETLIPEFLDTVRAIVEFPLPVVAAVHGQCLGGGCEVALAADVIISAESARFGQPEIQLGVLPPAACALLPARAPWGAAIDLVLGGEPLGSRDAEKLGLVRFVVPNEDLARTASSMAARFACHSRAALIVGKRTLLEASGDVRVPLERAGQRYLDDLMSTEDAIEGLQSFLEKRPPVWRHR
jgi:cyclohexa-1,5-dienecarbonyl-CoA hydratase